MGMKLPADIERRVLAQAGFALEARAKPAAPKLVAAAFTPPNCWVIPVVTASEANGRDWRARSRRSDAAWRAVSRAFGPTLLYVAPVAAAYHRGEAVRVRLTRLGGRALDRAVNLPSSLKGVEDAVAYFLAANDGDDRWRCEVAQEPGGLAGVRVELFTGEG